MKELAPGQNVNDLQEVLLWNPQCVYEPVLDRARHPAETSLVVLSFEDLDFGEGICSSGHGAESACAIRGMPASR